MAETELTDVFVELADTLTTDFDVVDFLHLLTQRCTDLLDVDTAGLLLSDPSVPQFVPAAIEYGTAQLPARRD
jgi:hypothetical protein